MDPAAKPADAPRGLAVPRQEDAVVPLPEFVLREPVELGRLFDQEDEIRPTLLDLDAGLLDDRRDGVPALPRLRAVNRVPVVDQRDVPDDAPAPLGRNVELLAE